MIWIVSTLSAAVLLGLAGSILTQKKLLNGRALHLLASAQVVILLAAIAQALAVPSTEKPAGVFLDCLAALATLVAAFGGALPATALLKDRSHTKTEERKQPSEHTKHLDATLTTANNRHHALKGTLTETKPPSQEILSGGFWVGILERTLIALAILSGQPGLLAVVIAAKGLARYPEIKSNEDAAEKFIIGTFVSALWAICSTLVVLLLK